MAEDQTRLSVINTYYSHVSRLFVSNYALFFAIYLAFLALLYNVVKSPTLDKNQFLGISVLIALFESGLLWRGWRFGEVLNQIDHLWAEGSIIDVRQVFWPERTWRGRINSLLRTMSVLTAMFVIISIPLLSWFFVSPS